jgi:LysM repeat protein
LGRHSKPKRNQISRRLTTVATVPALAGAAAVLCMSSQAMASTLGPHTATDRVAATDTARATVGEKPSQLLAASRQAVAATVAQPAKYTVRDGDTLSAIAARVYHDQAAWPVLYWANHSQVHYANDLSVGQVLKVPAKPAKIPAAPDQLGAAAAPVEVVSASSSTASPVYATTRRASSSSTYSGGGGFASCVIARESGGNSQVMNSSGHYGLYQFSASTWAAYGGSAADFGHASVAEQNQVFGNAIAAGGQSNWSAYDGC